MKPAITLLVHSRSGAATALAEVGRKRAADIGLAVDIIRVGAQDLFASGSAAESVTAVVPVDFASVQHEAWCLLCQLSLLRRSVGFSILVLGTESNEAFQARQRALLARSPSRRKRAA